MSVDLSQFIPSFLEESFEGLELMESSLLNLEQGDDETINSIFRAAHSIKGGAGTFGFNNVTEFTHLVETLLDEMRDGRRNIAQDDVELLLDSVDCMRLLIEAIRDESEYDNSKIVETSSLLEKTLASVDSDINDNTSVTLPEDNSETNTGLTCWQIKFIPEHHLVQTGNDPLLLFNALSDLGDVSLVACSKDLPALNDIDAEELYLSWDLTLQSNASEEDIKEVFEWVEDECELVITKEEIDNDTKPTPVIEDVVVEGAIEEPEEIPATIENIIDKPPETPSKSNTDKPSAKAKADLGSIRVGVDKVDSLINLVGELVITQSMLSELGNDFDLAKVDRLNSGLEQLLQNTKELQESVMRIRMLPISFAFNRFPRLVHDLSKKTGKEIELILKGEQTELDKTVMEQIGDPLVHLVRNAVDHGIESAEVRLANGKPEKGTIMLNAYHQGGSIVIEIKDDGGGINRQAVFNKALEKGIVDENSTLTDNQVFDLLFEPGFSTAKEVSDISGRGVGMDVVKKNIQALGGRIQVDSEQGKGSTFRVNLPLTLAILDGQLVKVGTETYIIPLITIVESLQPQKELINRVSGDMILYRLREDNVPVLKVYELFNIPCEFEDIENSLLVVVEADGQKVGLMVDDLLAQQQVVIKSLNDNYQQVEGISGATILGDGSVAMILDIPGIIVMALAKASMSQTDKFSAQPQITKQISEGVNL
jgi:two-component system chemotaxis sensor kinase CheA